MTTSLDAAAPTNPKTMDRALREPASRVIYAILFVALIIRLYHINFPVGGFQAWRQADTAAMARNFYENGFNFLYPQIDWGGNSPGYVETEFPLYSFLVAVLYSPFSPSDMIGRLTSVACSLVAILGLYHLVRRILGNRIAVWSAGLYAALPLNIFYTRAFMPESMMVMSSILGVYFFVAWVQEDEVLQLLLSAFFVALAALLKIPSLYLGVPIVYLAWTRYGWALLHKWKMWMYAAAVLGPVSLWYYHAHQIYIDSGLTFGIWMFGTNKWGMVGPLLTLKFYNDVFFKSLAERHLTYGAFIPFVFGLISRRLISLERLFDWWLIGLLIYVALVPLGHQIHEYYQLPFAIPASVFAAKFLSKPFLRGESIQRSLQDGRRRQLLSAFFLVAVALLSGFRISNFMRGERLDNPIFEIGKIVERATSKGDLVVAVSEGDPIYLYAAKRKGWHATPLTLNDSLLAERAHEGARVLFGDVATFQRSNSVAELSRLLGRYPQVVSADRYFAVRIDIAQTNGVSLPK